MYYTFTVQVQWQLVESSSQIKTVTVLQLSMNLTHIYILHIENFKNKMKTSVKWNMFNKISFKIIFFFLGKWFHINYTQIWEFGFTEILYTGLFSSHAIFILHHLHTVLPWLEVVFKEKQYEYCSSSSPKFALWQQGLKEQKIKRANISLYAETGHLKAWWLCMEKKEDVKMKYMYAIS